MAPKISTDISHDYRVFFFLKICVDNLRANRIYICMVL